ncbi:bifunctional aminoglycoside phosphotransferase/ATP-binding protein [Labrenzia sp. OB1]|uniref:bifunctional aminoglycoside phosphotransferase/ATP-binding protein n=1 Tax=Labrenzia sp. OB1 TaxID=1561204 RepID=UPI0007B2B46F|nr:bifunctional aminoglycoside phosphotransferase/ATP-binding protein [Labrenzia sp. OB1]KZM51643.1 aminoglycoside phosphotransferase [Labrenzia sp. OB1]
MAPARSQDDVLKFLETLPSDDPGCDSVKRIDTHANIVFLTGGKAYKVKREVRFPFLDYSTLALREEACRAEITCNRDNAPQIYLRALPVTLEADGRLALDGAGDPVEWAVEMNRFDRSNELDIMAERAPFSDDLSDSLAEMMVSAHEAAPLRGGAGFHDELATYIEQNEAAFHEFPELFASEDVRHLGDTSRSVLTSLRELILKRGEQGLVRRCHGDAHLRNIVQIDGKPVLFDAVEFSDAIATGDVLYDLAFLLMDLWERGQRRAANRVFNRYLDKSRLDEHPDGLAALPFYLMMRAAIRSKIAASAALNQKAPDQRDAQQQQARTYFKYALSFLDPSEPHLVAIGGLSGTGKTTLAYSLAPGIGHAPGARVLRTDVTRKRLLNIPETGQAPAEAYTQEASDRVYQTLDETIRAVLAAGHSAIFDAVFAAQDERSRIEAIARHVEAGFTGLWLTAPGTTLKARVSGRVGDASDATTDVVDKQLGYDLGQMTWAEIDAGGSMDNTTQLAGASLGLKDWSTSR